MANFTSNTYQMKREILTFSNKISKKLSKPDRKFTADMTYGILANALILQKTMEHSTVKYVRCFPTELLKNAAK